MKKLTYSVLRVIDRFKMAVIISDIVSKCGATYIRKEGGTYPGPRAVTLEVKAPGGLQVDIRFDGDAIDPDVFHLSWYMAGDSRANLNPALFDNVNQHQRKATSVAEGFDALCEQLEQVLMQAKEGTVYADSSELVPA